MNHCRIQPGAAILFYMIYEVEDTDGKIRLLKQVKDWKTGEAVDTSGNTFTIKGSVKATPIGLESDIETVVYSRRFTFRKGTETNIIEYVPDDTIPGQHWRIWWNGSATKEWSSVASVRNATIKLDKLRAKG